MNHKHSISCLNCGKYGHTTKLCRFPTNSYGCVVFKKSADNTIRYLLVQRKYTPEYVELLRGRYYGAANPHELNYQYLLLLIATLPLTERNYIIQYDFDYLWKNVWRWNGTEEQMRRIYHDYDQCEQKFNLLKQGYTSTTHGYLSFQQLFEKNPTQIIEPDWELPKGKRRIGETDQACAIREFTEESGIELSDISLYLHVKPFQEKFTGINAVRYCSSYYIGQLVNPLQTIYYDPDHIEQNKEIRKIGWFTIDQIDQLINPRYIYRLKMIHDIDALVSTKLS